MAKRKVKNKSDDSKLYALLGILLTIIGFIVVYATKKNDKYAMYYAKQGLVLFIVGVVASIVMMVLVFIPILGWLINLVIWIGLLALWIIGILNSLSGKQKEIPFIGQFADKWFKSI